MKNWSSRLYPPSSNPPMGIQYASNQRSCSSIENGLTELGRKNQKTLKDAGNPTLKEKACKSCSTNVDFRRNGMIRKDHGILCYQQYCISCHKINISDKNNPKKLAKDKQYKVDSAAKRLELSTEDFAAWDAENRPTSGNIVKLNEVNNGLACAHMACRRNFEKNGIETPIKLNELCFCSDKCADDYQPYTNSNAVKTSTKRHEREKHLSRMVDQFYPAVVERAGAIRAHLERISFFKSVSANYPTNYFYLDGMAIGATPMLTKLTNIQSGTRQREVGIQKVFER